ncbi:MAG: metallophosphoesterase family protein [Clostridia bacterium]|nr:metallophosphoesterase family protein [Clostridia bacterium]
MKKHLVKVLTVCAIVIALTVQLCLFVFAGGEGFDPKTLTLQPGANTSSVNLNWYAEGTATQGKVEFKDADGKKITVDAKSSDTEFGEKAMKATVSGLKAGTNYKYKVSNDNGTTWSKEYSFNAPKAGSFRFALVGDPQIKYKNDAHGLQASDSAAFSSDKTVKQGWADTVKTIQSKNVNFIASVGDQVDTSTKTVEEEYNGFFAPEFFRSNIIAPAVGNHDRHQGFINHYNLPNEQDVSDLIKIGVTPAASEVTANRGNYFYRYNNALFVVLNDSPYPGNKEEAKPYIDAYRRTLEKATAANKDAKWIFVQHHKSTASVAQHVADRDIQYYVEAGLENLFDEFNVDFVLAGHDHVYARSYVMKGGKRNSKPLNDYKNPDGRIYMTVNTGSGLKYYGIFSSKLYVKDNSDYPYLANGKTGSEEYMKKVFPLSTHKAEQTRLPGYSIIEVTENKVTFSTYSTYDNVETMGDETQATDVFSVSKVTDKVSTQKSDKKNPTTGITLTGGAMIILSLPIGAFIIKKRNN